MSINCCCQNQIEYVDVSSTKGSKLNFENRYSQLKELYESEGTKDYIGEAVTQLEHGLQCAYFAEKSNADEDVILAALLHDVGHICASKDSPEMEGLGVVDHEGIGASYLNKLGLTQVGPLVEGHVQAKRYMCYKNPAYYNSLSEASKGTLHFQGGPMTEEEGKKFLKDPNFKKILQVRAFDDKGKRTDLKVPPFDYYRPMILNNLKAL